MCSSDIVDLALTAQINFALAFTQYFLSKSVRRHPLHGDVVDCTAAGFVGVDSTAALVVDAVDKLPASSARGEVDAPTSVLTGPDVD